MHSNKTKNLLVKLWYYFAAQVNPNMPRTFGDGIIHMSHFDAMVQCSDPLPEMGVQKIGAAEETIGKFIAENLVHDGATLQMGKFKGVKYSYNLQRVYL